LGVFREEHTGNLRGFLRAAREGREMTERRGKRTLKGKKKIADRVRRLSFEIASSVRLYAWGS
jgi:hypothetical protein